MRRYLTSCAAVLAILVVGLPALRSAPAVQASDSGTYVPTNIHATGHIAISADNSSKQVSLVGGTVVVPKVDDFQSEGLEAGVQIGGLGHTGLDGTSYIRAGIVITDTATPNSATYLPYYVSHGGGNAPHLVTGLSTPITAGDTVKVALQFPTCVGGLCLYATFRLTDTTTSASVADTWLPSANAAPSQTSMGWLDVNRTPEAGAFAAPTFETLWSAAYASGSGWSSNVDALSTVAWLDKTTTSDSPYASGVVIASTTPPVAATHAFTDTGGPPSVGLPAQTGSSRGTGGGGTQNPVTNHGPGPVMTADTTWLWTWLTTTQGINVSYPTGYVATIQQYLSDIHSGVALSSTPLHTQTQYTGSGGHATSDVNNTSPWAGDSSQVYEGTPTCDTPGHDLKGGLSWCVTEAEIVSHLSNQAWLSQEQKGLTAPYGANQSWEVFLPQGMRVCRTPRRCLDLQLGRRRHRTVLWVPRLHDLRRALPHPGSDGAGATAHRRVSREREHGNVRLRLQLPQRRSRRWRH